MMTLNPKIINIFHGKYIKLLVKKEVDLTENTRITCTLLSSHFNKYLWSKLEICTIWKKIR